MNPIDRLLKTTGMSREDLAKLAQLTQGELDADGPDTLRQVAMTMGMTVAELVAGEPPPAGGMYRTWLGEPAALDELRIDGTSRTLGGFLRDLRHVRGLDAQLDDPLPALPAWAHPVPPEDTPDHGAKALAAQVRKQLELGTRPIASVWSLARQLGVQCADVSPDELSQHLDGASWRDPATLIANRVGGPHRTRMTVCHELGHILFDEASCAISPARGLSVLYRLRVKAEQRANAFAAYVLVPPERVFQILNGRRPDPESLREVAVTFGVGIHVAGNVLTNLFSLSESERDELIQGARDDAVGRAVWSPVPSKGPGSPRRQLLQRVERALARGLLDEVTARMILGIRLSQPLPFGDHPPVLSDYARVRLAVLKHFESLGRHDVTPKAIELEPSGYRVQLERAWPDGENRTLVQPTQVHVTRDFLVA